MKNGYTMRSVTIRESILHYEGCNKTTDVIQSPDLCHSRGCSVDSPTPSPTPPRLNYLSCVHHSLPALYLDLGLRSCSEQRSLQSSIYFYISANEILYYSYWMVLVRKTWVAEEVNEWVTYRKMKGLKESENREEGGWEGREWWLKIETMESKWGRGVELEVWEWESRAGEKGLKVREREREREREGERERERERERVWEWVRERGRESE